MNAPQQVTSPWFYFLLGNILPTIAYFAYKKTSPSSAEEERDDDDEYEDSDDEYAHFHSNKSSREWGMSDAPYKMILVVNHELGMGKGKIAAQCGHASVGCYKRATKMCPGGTRAWEFTGCAKIAVKCPTEEEMRSIYDTTLDRGLPLYIVEDAGRTQIAAGSRTVLAIFGPTYIFEGLTSHLKLL
uniref:peptidyl-tRNA hydrolase n=1 Tax=Pseudo-nitzschia australis TaxID=44445 RepID=A0A7S4AR74_9STRA|mmetsp:Transcript_25760/g.56515  ORF Transcript_25760/g.56515 Transcript_25760/m.56515 type:complete len:186 (+) Transcript_25760:143-700(+)